MSALIRMNGRFFTVPEKPERSIIQNQFAELTALERLAACRLGGQRDHLRVMKQTLSKGEQDQEN